MTSKSIGAQLLLGAVLTGYLCSSAQAQSAFESALTVHGRPDLQGVWYFGSTTPFTRSAELGEQDTYSAEEVAELEQQAYQSNAAQTAPLDPDRSAPESGVYIGFEADFNFATLRHERQPVLGEYRTSLIIEPANGQLPIREGFEDFNAKRSNAGVESYSSAQAADSGERCLVGGLAIPSLYPMPWNANLQIVQNKDYVVLVTEMIHDARIVKLSGNSLGEHMNYWYGDSTGSWDDNTLVVHTRNFRPEHSQFLLRMSEDLEVTERFTRISDDEILYRVELMDPQALTERVVVERTLLRRPTSEPIYEFACHEGNYSLQYMLMGARRSEVAADIGAAE